MKMKIILLTISVSLNIGAQELRYKRGKLEYPKTEVALLAQKTNREINEQKLISQKLAEVKFALINGNIERAKILLMQQGFNQGFGKIIKKRYLSIINFIEGKYRQSLDILRDESFLFDRHYVHICSLKTLNELILNEVASASETWKRCNKLTVLLSENLNLWPGVLVDLKTDPKNAIKRPFEKLNITNESRDTIRLYLKLALYLNQQKIILPKVPDFSPEVFQDRELRELIGLLYYREAELVRAYEFIEDLDTPNSENIKGNLYLAQNKYELAYGQFKLALKKKNNSQNALERITPVAWLLSQWDDGANYVEEIRFQSEEERFRAKVLKSSFLTMAKKYPEAEKNLKEIVRGSKLGYNQEVTQLYSYVATELKQSDDVLLYANRACGSLEPINCWYLYHLEMWENFPLTLSRKDKTFTNDNEKLQAFFEPFDDKFKEDKYIQQKNIEELDEKLIRLIDNT